MGPIASPIAHNFKGDKMFIGEATHKGKLIMVSRDNSGKFFVSVNGQRIGVKLNASEMCRWFLNTMHSPPAYKGMDDNALRIESDKILKKDGKIIAIKYIRECRNWGLREAMDYLKTSQHWED